MKVNDLCAVRAMVNGAWTPNVYLANIVEFEEDEHDNWHIDRVRIVGEKEDRLSDDPKVVGISRIPGDDKQLLAKKLAGDQWGQIKAYKDYDELRSAILAKG